MISKKEIQPFYSCQKYLKIGPKLSKRYKKIKRDYIKFAFFFWHVLKIVSKCVKKNFDIIWQKYFWANWLWWEKPQEEIFLSTLMCLFFQHYFPTRSYSKCMRAHVIIVIFKNTQKFTKFSVTKIENSFLYFYLINHK